MTLSIWRYSHLLLAVSSSLFLMIAALSGIVLAFEPVHTSIASQHIPKAGQVTLAQTINSLQEEYLEVFSILVTKDGKVSASVITADGDLADVYIDPVSGKKVADIQEENSIYSFARDLHRSLFLKTPGRLFVGVCSLLLLIIAITGMILVIKRQQGFRYFFSPIVKESFYQYGHVYVGRLFLIPIAFIAFTGVLLSLFRFNVLSHPNLEHSAQKTMASTIAEIPVAEFSVFQETPLSDVVSVDFPFSPDASDFYQLHLKTKELLVQQYTGEVISKEAYPFAELAYRWGYNTHTGETNVLWACILLASAVSILFFIFSGFKLTFKRRQGRIKNTCKASESTHIILVGSETGSTFPFAVWLQKELIKTGKKAYVAEMNAYQFFPKMQQLLVLTATYGVGEAPVNATKFIEKLAVINQGAFEFCVVGFGSFAYPNYCQFAYEVHNALLAQKNTRNSLDIHTVNNRSVESYNQWLLQYGQYHGFVPSPYVAASTTTKASQKVLFTVISKTELHQEQQTFLLELTGNQRKRFISGDLLAIAPNKESHDRLYSVGVSDQGGLLLSIKLHAFGACSNYLHQLHVGDTLLANRIKNSAFYFPKKAPVVIMIATGTGIAPFLGMMQCNTQKISTHLFWGARNVAALEPYAPIVNKSLAMKQLAAFIPAYSRETNTKVYVQDRIMEQQKLIASTFQQGGVVMLCGSVHMQRAVLEVLTSICNQYCDRDLSYYQKKKQVRMDCY